MQQHDSRSLHLMPGIGSVTAGWLKEVGIETVADLRAVGAVAAYARLKHRDPRRASLNALWALHGVLTGVPWNQLDAPSKALLLAELGGR